MDFLAIFLLILLVAGTPILAFWIYSVFSEKERVLISIFKPLEHLLYKLSGVDPKREMDWKEYGKALLFFNLFGFIFLFLLLLFQGSLPLNPQKLPNVSWALALNTAVSFVTNTNWQAYAGESTMSYFSQMVGLASQNFLSAASGFCVFLVLMRGIHRKETKNVGNFFVDLIRSIVYLLLPLSFIFALFLVSQGVIQSLSPYQSVETLEKGVQVIPMGPVASQVAIKQLGTNGGGFFNANSAHPFENPTLWSNLFETAAILLIPAATVYAYGLMTGHRKHALVLLVVMTALWGIGIAVSAYGESINDPLIQPSPVWEGKETRFGALNSLIWSVSTSGTSNGSVNAMMSSLSPLAGGMALLNLILGEIIFGGIGVGLCGMLMFVILTVFLSGLMVGRTPEYLGKKIERREMQWVSLAILGPSALILVGAALSLVNPIALEGLSIQGPHGLTEMLYAYSSAAANNGSAFGGLNANLDYFNVTLALAMFLGRVFILLPTLAVAGLLAEKKSAPPSIGTFSLDSPLFGILLFATILLVGGLTFFPALSLGPVLEHLLMLEGRGF